jgi:tellurite resistance protein
LPDTVDRNMAAKKQDGEKTASLDLEAHAKSIREGLQVPKQNDVFRAAVEAAYLAALADGEVDDQERDAMVRAVELLSEGAVVEWEAESLLDDCAARAEKDGAQARAEAVGKELAALGQAQVGVFVAAVVARASKGIDKREAEALKAVGIAAGLAPEAIKDIVKRASAL